jgi:hypothetical protein
MKSFLSTSQLCRHFTSCSQSDVERVECTAASANNSHSSPLTRRVRILTAMDQIVTAIEPLRQFSKDSLRWVGACSPVSYNCLLNISRRSFLPSCSAWSYILGVVCVPPKSVFFPVPLSEDDFIPPTVIHLNLHFTHPLCFGLL